MKRRAWLIVVGFVFGMNVAIAIVGLASPGNWAAIGAGVIVAAIEISKP
jgi:hypothetical protein